MDNQRQIVVQDENMRIEKLSVDPFGTNAYIVVCLATGESVLVDAPGEPDRLLERLKGSKPARILLTHSHADHTLALEELKTALVVPVCAHAEDSAALPVQPDCHLADGDNVRCGRLELSVFHTPGHTPGSLCFKIGPYLLSGDTIFPGGPGKTGSPAELAQIIRSITENIFKLPDETRLFPGHGDSTTVAREKELYSSFASRPRDPNLCGDVTWQ